MCPFKFCNHSVGEEREIAALLKLCYCYRVAVSVLCLFLVVSWVGLQCVIVAFPGHIHLRLGKIGKLSN